jgi:hypothetical protein
LVAGTIELEGAGNTEREKCTLRLDGNETTFDDIGVEQRGQPA